MWCQDLDSQPSERESPPKTTRLGLPFVFLLFSSLEQCSIEGTE